MTLLERAVQPTAAAMRPSALPEPRAAFERGCRGPRANIEMCPRGDVEYRNSAWLESAARHRS